MTGATLRYLSVCSGIEAATFAWHSLGWEPVAFSVITLARKTLDALIKLQGRATTFDDHGQRTATRRTRRTDLNENRRRSSVRCTCWLEEGNMTYEQAYKDHKYLWDIAPAYDMTGGYEDQHDLDKLLKSPTKKTAKECLCSQIEYWFQAGPDPYGIESGDPRYWVDNDPLVLEIAERHGCL